VRTPPYTVLAGLDGLLEQKVNANGEFKCTTKASVRNIELEARLIDDV